MKRILGGGVALLVLAGCQSSGGELRGIADAPPIDRTVLLTGGALLLSSATGNNTFGAGDEVVEAIPIEAVRAVLEQGHVFHRIDVDQDAGRRLALRQSLVGYPADPAAVDFMQLARDQGFDLLLVVESLQDGPIDRQGTNGRWPLTFATWILLGVGMLIPDRTFESRATLRVTLRDLQTGAVLHDPVLLAGPVELSLTERTNLLGLLVSIVVPPFWVADDEVAVVEALRDITRRRLLLSLARDLKSESVRQRLAERSAADIKLIGGDGGPRLVVVAREPLTVAHLRSAEVDDATSAAFAARLLATRSRDGERYRYEAPLPPAACRGLVQVLVGMISGSVASATFAAGGRP